MQVLGWKRRQVPWGKRGRQLWSVTTACPESYSYSSGKIGRKRKRRDWEKKTNQNVCVFCISSLYTLSISSIWYDTHHGHAISQHLDVHTWHMARPQPSVVCEIQHSSYSWCPQSAGHAPSKDKRWKDESMIRIAKGGRRFTSFFQHQRQYSRSPHILSVLLLAVAATQQLRRPVCSQVGQSDRVEREESGNWRFIIIFCCL